MADTPRINTPAPKKAPEEAYTPPAATAAAPKSATERATKLSAKATGFDLLRPFRLMGGFVHGTVYHGLNGIAKGGNMGLWLGAAVGILGCVAGGLSLPVFASCLLGGALAGIAVGGAAGIIGGGIRGTQREMRREKYSDDLAQRHSKSHSSGPQRFFDAQGWHEEQKQVSDVNFDRYQQQQRENQHDRNTYWQDRVDHERRDDTFMRGF